MSNGSERRTPSAESSRARSGSRQPVVVASRYELGAEIGRGGCAIVHEARDRRLDRVVAVKVLHPGARDENAASRLLRETRVGVALHHPNVCSVTDAGFIDAATPFLVMERLFGRTLRAHLNSVGWLDLDDAFEYGQDLLSALAHAHSLGVVHRDLKPENVFLVDRPGCRPLLKLLDFGLCRRASSDEHTLTQHGLVMGTPEYMAPEQVFGARRFDARVDLFAVGVLLYEALTGVRAFAGPNPGATMMAVLVNELAPVRVFRDDVPRRLERTLARALQRSPSARYDTADEFLADLLAARARHRAKRGSAASGRRVASSPPASELPTQRIVVDGRDRIDRARGSDASEPAVHRKRP